VTIDTMAMALGKGETEALRDASFRIYEAGRAHAAERGIIIADTKFEFGRDADGTLRLIDEVLTPDSSRFWPADRYAPGRSQPSFDKQPLRDYLAALKAQGSWNGDAPPPTLPQDVLDTTSARYVDAYERLTGHALPEDG
jgi:phosphoribosylaminoimidazole-succinocarboxamide synthase